MSEPVNLPIDAAPETTLRTGVTLNLPTPAVALGIGAHPDDVEFAAGGTLAKWAGLGCVVHHLICTDGSKGTWDPAQSPDELIALRQSEQRAAAQAMGATGEVVFLGHVDGELDSSLEVRSQVAREIRRLRPDVVLGHDPWKRYRLHPDHRHAGLVAVEGIVAARDPLFFTEHGLDPHRPEALLLWEADEPDHVEDITAGVDGKLTALRAHASQFRTTMGVHLGGPGAREQWERFEARVRERAQGWGRFGGCTLGEGFKLIDQL